MSRRKQLDSQQMLFDLPGKLDDKRRGRMTISQISFIFTCGLSFTAVRSCNSQKHSERLPCQISFAVPTLSNIEALKRSIRSKALQELERLSEQNGQSNSISTPGHAYSESLPGLDA